MLTPDEGDITTDTMNVRTAPPVITIDLATGAVSVEGVQGVDDFTERSALAALGAHDPLVELVTALHDAIRRIGPEMAARHTDTAIPWVRDHPQSSPAMWNRQPCASSGNHTEHSVLPFGFQDTRPTCSGGSRFGWSSVSNTRSSTVGARHLSASNAWRSTWASIMSGANDSHRHEL